MTSNHDCFETAITKDILICSFCKEWAGTLYCEECDEMLGSECCEAGGYGNGEGPYESLD